MPHPDRELERVEEGVAFLRKAEYERLNTTWKVLSLGGGYDDVFEWPAEADEITVVARAADNGDRWFESEFYRYRLHAVPRLQCFVPTLEVGGLDP